jgi:hypothetical protein
MKIFFGNGCAEALISGLSQSGNKHYIQHGANLARRYLWTMQPGDLIITHCAGDPDYVCYVEDCCQYQRGSIKLISAYDGIDNFGLLNLKNLKTKKFFGKIEKYNFDEGSWHLEPFIADSDAFDFGNLINVPVRFGKWGTPSREAADLFNDKRVFRALAAGLNVPIASGRVCATSEQLAFALSELISATGSCIVKMDRHLGAEGNVLITHHHITNAPGTHKIYPVSDSQKYEDIAQTIYSELGQGSSPCFIVEVYYHNAHSVGVHYLLGDKTVTLNGVADIRLAPAYAGMFWPTSLPDTVVHQLIAEGHKLAYHVASLGHRGPLSVDAIVCAGNQIIVNEINARHGGFTAAKAVIDKITGSTAKSFFAATRAHLTSNMKFNVLRELLEQEGLSFNRNLGAGIVISAEDLQNTQQLEILTIAQSREAIHELEEKFINVACINNIKGY